jgi:hypothetical protein
VHLPKLSLAVTTIAISQLWFAIPMLAEEEMSAEQQFRLCSAFPLNSRCEGYTIPVALKQRPGHEGVCKMQAGETATAGHCKILLTDGLITVFVEEGDKLALLDDKQATREISVAVSDVSNLSYRETKKINVGETVGMTLLFGLPGLLFSRPDHFAEINLVLNNTTQSNLTALTLITDRNLGMNLRSSLERSTGLFAEVLFDEDDDAFCQDFPLNSRCQTSEQETDIGR